MVPAVFRREGQVLSYNVNSVDIISADNFGITPEALTEAEAAMPENGWPESNVFDQVRERGIKDFTDIVGKLARAARYIVKDADGRWLFQPGAFWFHGEGSGWAFDALRDVILPRFTGRADIVICWEGGDSYTGLRVVEGKVTAHEVIRALGKAKP